MWKSFRGPFLDARGLAISILLWGVACAGGGGGGQDNPQDNAATDVVADSPGPDVPGEAVVDAPPETPADVPGEAPAEAVGEAPVAGCKADCGAMVPVAAGAFQMGCNPAAPANCDADENPSHSVTMPAFEVDVTEVTVALWARCLDDGACTKPNHSSSGCNWGVAGRDAHPINCIEKSQAVAFCQWAGKRLCTEAEWEKAALGTDGRIYPWGNQAPTCALAVLDEGGFGCGTLTTAPVGSKPDGASPYGAMDMAGNVWEWVEDAYHASYAGAPADGSAWNLPAGTSNVARGGALSDKAEALRGSNRTPFDPALDGYYVGLRCCRSGKP